MIDLTNFKLDLRYNERVNEIFDAYRIKLTGSLDCRNDADIYGFIYKYQPRFLSEILMIMYQIGYEDGQKDAVRQVELINAKHGKLIVDNTKNNPYLDPPPANSAVSLAA